MFYVYLHGMQLRVGIIRTIKRVKKRQTSKFQLNLREKSIEAVKIINESLKILDLCSSLLFKHL